MRTSEEIYHRVRWDARFEPARFVMGVAQRGRAPKRVPLPRFTPGGEIPWHRVLFIEADGEVVWDRAAGVDRIDATQAGRVRAPRRLRSPYFTSRTPHAFCASRGTWAPVEGDVEAHPEPIGPLAGPSVDVLAEASGGLPTGTSSGLLSVVTWNTLWDRYDSDRIDTARRRPLLLEALRAADADVVALQEAEPALLALLLEAPWVREHYTLGTDPGGRDVADCGLLLLSRLPVREAGLHTLGPHKAVAAVVVEGEEGPVTVAVTHLSSDHSPNGADRRDTELTDIATGLAAVEGDVLLLGDFNDGGNTPQERLGMADAWTGVRGAADRTPTFDPSVNPLAAVSSLSGRASRLDRVLVRAEGWRPVSAVLLGDVPTSDGLYVSDHFGVRVELRTGAAQDDDLSAADTADRADTADGADGADEAWAAEIVRRVAAALPEARVHPVGSRRMGCALPGADVDLVAALPGDADVGGGGVLRGVGVRGSSAGDRAAADGRAAAGGSQLPGVRERLVAALPDAVDVREVTGARVPGLRFGLGGLRVDLVTVPTGALPPAEAVDRRTELGGATARALSAVSDADAVLAAAGPHRDAFAGLAREVKAWARARGLDSAPCGGLPGLAWSVLAARTAHDSGGLPPLPLLRHFFATWAVRDWDHPVGIGAIEESPGTVQQPLTVLTPTAPVRSCTTQVSAVGRDLVAEELFRAWEILESVPDTAPVPRALLHARPPLRQRHIAWALVSVRRGEDEGRFRGRILAVLAALAEAGAPDAHAWPRPYDTDASHVRYAIGLGRTPPDAARLAEIGGELLRGLPEARITRAEGGDAPEVC
ncbi:poly(A) polymerase [Streptomyces sp. NPDC014744]|uniref:poly(A) polymerase n=1 Tax=Streptomyces sp. NPDC014744 TaxID=3364903 RepID=UPI003701A028